jgi:N-acetylmuramoyl-L-alanine amidase
MGKYFVQGGMRAGINPLLVVAHAQKETGFGKDGSGIKSGSHNSFGRSASATQPGVTTSRKWYSWGSWEASLYAPVYPASGKVDQPDDIFQYIARRYSNNLDNGLTSYMEGPNGLPAYGPSSDGNDVPGYIAHITKVGQDIAAASGGAIDLTKLGGATTSVGGTSTTQAPTPSVSAPTTVVAIDPGHGGEVAQYTDPVTGLGDRETTNSPEREDMQDVANIVKSGLEGAGYTVVLLKNSATEAVSKRERIDKAKQAKATIGVSLHSDSGSGSFQDWAEVWPQFVGGYRESATDSSKKVTFSNADTASKSDSYSAIFREERDAAERANNGKTAKITGQAQSFAKSRGLPSFGDLSLMQLWADDIPWVYNEVGATAGGLSADQKQKYATGVINAIKRAVPSTGGEASGACSSSGGAVSGNLSATVLAYAWPKYRKRGSPGATDKKPEYAAAIDAAKAKKQYTGDTCFGGGVDCGAFVSRVIIDSGVDPGYNYDGKGGNTVSQRKWVDANWTKLVVKSTADLQPGDTAHLTGHTYMYVGKIDGFESVIASASQCHRAGMAGAESPIDPEVTWYRKKTVATIPAPQ